MADVSSSLSRIFRFADELFAHVKQHTLVELLLLQKALDSMSHGVSLILNHHPPPNGAGVSIMAYDYFLDLDQQALTIDWEIWGCGKHALQTYGPQVALRGSIECGPFNQSVDIYLNDASNRVFSYDPGKLPVDPAGGPVYIQELSSFTTIHKLHPSSLADSHSFDVFAFAIDRATNISVNISRFAISNSLEGFAISSRDLEVVERFDCHTANGYTEIKPHALRIEVGHSKSSRAFSLCVFATNWTLTLASAYVTITAVMNGRVGFMAVVLHASVALAIPYIRKLCVSPPPFGAVLDIAGFISQIAIMALSSLVLVYNASKLRFSGRTPIRSLEKT